MIINIFGYYINIFKAKPSHTVGNEPFQVRRYENYLILCDNDGYRISTQTKMLITNNVNEPSACTIELFCDLNHIDEQPIARPLKPLLHTTGAELVNLIKTRKP